MSYRTLSQWHWLFTGLAACLVIGFLHQKAEAYSGGVGLYLTAQETTLEPGEETTVFIRMDTSDLVTAPNEKVQTVSVYIGFPTNMVEVLNLDFTGSAFNSDYVRDYDNVNGSIEIVRARSDSAALSGQVLIGAIVVRAKANGPDGTAQFSFLPGLNNVLLNDVYNSDVLDSVAGLQLTIGAGGANPGGNDPADDDDDSGDGPTSATVDASIWLTAGSTALNVGDTTTAQIRVNTGSAGNNVTSTDLRMMFPKSLLRITPSSVNNSNGVLKSSTTNTINNTTGRIDLILFNNPPVSTSNGLIGTFTVERIAEGDATISVVPGSSLLINDVQNTNVLQSTNPITFTMGGPSVSASLSPASISSSQATTVTFASAVTGSYAVRQGNCSTGAVLVTGQYNTANQAMNVPVAGSQIGVGQNKQLVVCLQPGNGTTGQSGLLNVTVTSNGGGGGNGSGSGVKICVSSPNPANPNDNIALSFVSSTAGTVSLHRDTCSGTPIAFTRNGSTANSYAMTPAEESTSCSANSQTIQVSTVTLGSSSSNPVAVCVENGGQTEYAVANLSINYSGRTSGGGGGGGGGARHASPIVKSSKTKNANLPNCTDARNLQVHPGNDGRFKYTWDRLEDPNIDKLQMAWGQTSGETEGSIDIPVVTTINLPGKEITPNVKYYYRVVSTGKNCNPTVSNEVTAIKRDGTPLMTQSVEPPPESSQQALPPTIPMVQSSAMPPRDDIARNVSGTPAGGAATAGGILLFSFLLGWFVWRRSKVGD